MMLRSIAAALVGALALGPVAAGARAQQARDTTLAASRAQLFARDFHLGFDVTLGTIAAPLHWSKSEWVAVPALGIALVTLSGADEPVQHMFDRNHSGGASRVLDQIEPFGTERAIATVVGTYLVGLALDAPGLRRVGVEAAASSIVAAGIVTPSLKRIFGRSRPWAARGPFDFHSMSGNESFPSGHTTQAFAAASVFAAEAHPLWAKALIYGVAGGVATARLYHDAHFLSDVAAGATIGTVVGRSVVARTHGVLRGGVAPYVGGEGVGLVLRF